MGPQFCYSPSDLRARVPGCYGEPWADPRGARGRGFEFDQGVKAISKKVFVGNLNYDVTREELLEAFGAAGKVVDAKVPTDRETGRPRGFAFVEFEDEEAAQKSISLLNGKDLKGRALRVNEAEDRPPRPPGSGGGGGGYRPSFGGGGGGGGGYRGAPPPMMPPPDFPGEFRKDDRSRSFRGKKTSERPAPRRNNQRRKKDDPYDDD